MPEPIARSKPKSEKEYQLKQPQDRDPTNGFVNYVDRNSAQNSGLVSASSGPVYIGVDHTNHAPDGRSSVRITSTKSYQHGLFVLDLAHMPGGVCGAWPAL